jgi:hypothetical protein
MVDGIDPVEGKVTEHRRMDSGTHGILGISSVKTNEVEA